MARRAAGAVWRGVVVAGVVAGAGGALGQDPELELAEPRPPFALRPNPEGPGYIYEHTTFTAYVAPDGSVEFENEPARLGASGLAGALAAGNFVAQPEAGTWLGVGSDWIYRGNFAPPDSPYGWYLPAPPLERPYTPDVPYNRYLPLQPPLAAYTVRFDLTDAVMLWRGEDPYALDKGQFLAATFDFRVGLAARYDEAQMVAGLAALPEYLHQIWTDPRLTPVERRQVLFQLWEETRDDADGRRARAIIESFIQQRLPAGSAEAYPERELQRYQTVGFDPYE